MMTLVFDLDDTLYPELSYVESGFRAVAVMLSKVTGISADDWFTTFHQELQLHGRGRVFNRGLRKYGFYGKYAVQRCLSIYRSHRPDIALSAEARTCLKGFGQWPKYIVTDGHKKVQRNKIQALQLYPMFKRCIASYSYGVQHGKPSPYLFHEICRWEQTNPESVVYIGDNPKKDFVGIKPFGFRTIRVHTGPYANLKVGPEYDADYHIRSLAELTPGFLTELSRDTKE